MYQVLAYKVINHSQGA